MFWGRRLPPRRQGLTPGSVGGVDNGDLAAKRRDEVGEIVGPQSGMDAVRHLQFVFFGGDDAGPGFETAFEADGREQLGFDGRGVQHGGSGLADANDLNACPQVSGQHDDGFGTHAEE